MIGKPTGPERPEAGHNGPNRRNAAPGIVLGVVAIGIEGLVMSPILQDIAQAFGADTRQAAWAVAVYGLTLALVAPPMALWGGRWPRQRLMAAGLAVFVLAGLLCALASHFTMLLIARALCGVGAGLFVPACYAHVGDNTPYEDRGRVMGQVMAGWSLALILGVPLGAAAGAHWGWRATFAGVALMGAVALALVLRLPAAAPAAPGKRSVAREAASVWRSHAPVYLGANFLDMISFYGVYTFLGAVVRDRLGMGSGGFGLFVLCYGLGLLTSTLNAAWLDRVGKQRAAMRALMGIAAVLATLPWATGHAAALAACMLAWGVVQGLTQTAMATLLTQAGGPARGFAMACMSCTTYLAVAAGAAGGGLLLEAQGFGVLARGGAACALVACGLVAWVHRARPGPGGA